MFKKISGIVGVTLAMAACAVDTTGAGDESIGNRGLAYGACEGPSMEMDKVFAELAVAMANELGRLVPARDLVLMGSRLVLSNEASSRCGNGCEVTRAVLALQNEAVNEIWEESVFSAAAFRQTLVSRYQEAQARSQGLPPAAHILARGCATAAECSTEVRFDTSWPCQGRVVATVTRS